MDGTKAHFTIDVDAVTLASEPGEFEIELTLRVGDLVRSRSLHDHRETRSLAARNVGDKIVDTYSDRRGYLALRVTEPAATIASTEIRGRSIRVELEAAQQFTSLGLVRTSDRFNLPIAVESLLRTGPTTARATLRLPAEPSAAMGGDHRRRVWRLVVGDDSGRWSNVTAARDTPYEGDTLGAASVTIERRLGGALLRSRVSPADPHRDYIPGATAIVVERLHCATVTAVTVMGTELRVSLAAFGLSPRAEIELTSGKTTIVARVSEVDGAPVARFDLAGQNWGISTPSLPRGDYRLRIVDSGVTITPFVSGDFAQRLPMVEFGDHVRAWIAARPNRSLQISLSAPLRNFQRSPYQLERQRASSILRVADREPQPSVFFRSLYGEVAGDSAEAIHHELRRRSSSLKLLWSTVDASVPIPEGGDRIYEGSTEFVRAISESKYVVVNVHQPDWFAKSPGQTLIQTMHGYPFKLAGRRHWEVSDLPPSRVESFLFRASEWDYFVSPSAYSTPLLEEFLPADWTGTMLEIGYPRNDVLVRDHSELRRTTRAALGIPDGRIAVLYAPTYRDYLSVDEFRAEALTALDLRALASALSRTHTILVRGHVMNARMGFSKRSPNVIDVTEYPSIAGLTAASDAAILDYSSLRFDYALTGKPMLFFNPDRERYFESRPSMMPYEGTAPGPWLTSTSDVTRALRRLDRIEHRFASDVDRFRSRFMELEDGNAAARLVDRVFVPRGDA
ncbi:hypothetical protein GCM10025870_07980 [Agromyces marinus]|uniref:CDP-glycerol glycerophosphotransferase, TagB/SpsB family n=2 Tax=Agromyces marinus TaxID=1389020 RepID=A0ABM8GYZ7_9MICO|nr:CDP-glycerol glycerophosphotransferase family protein [Agromyces marinus]BDZ53725.1 hypothetical protein GCM10025870_07980 [Agromyces marinus]